MDNKEKKGFSSISDLSSDINEKDHSQTAEDKPSMSQTEKNELEQFEKENSSDVYLKRDSDKSNLSHSNTNKASYIKN